MNGPYSVSDDKVASVDCSAATSPLAVGNSTTCVGTYTTTSADMTAGSMANSASDTASDGLHTITSNLATVTITLPTPTSIFSNATFTYDGDGKRVKSIIETDIATTTTYFVSNYYEVVEGKTGTQVNKYYYAGAQRIATLAPDF